MAKTALADVWASSDRGKSWTQVCHAAPWEGRQGHTCAVLDNEVYLLGGVREMIKDKKGVTTCGRVRTAHIG